MRLALALGEPNPDAMLVRMPASVYLDWVAFAGEEQWWAYDDRNNYRAALIAWTVASGIPRKKGASAPKFENFVLDFKPREPTDLLTKMKAINTMMGGDFVDLREKDGN